MSSQVQVMEYQVFKAVLYSFRELEGINSAGIENQDQPTEDTNKFPWCQQGRLSKTEQCDGTSFLWMFTVT